jgi:hypothetical protein
LVAPWRGARSRFGSLTIDRFEPDIRRCLLLTQSGR